MTTFLEGAYSIVGQDVGPAPSANELRTALEKGSEEIKIITMQRILSVMLGGDPLPSLLMPIIRFVMPSKNKQLKKLLYLYYELCPKHGKDGKLLQEWILVCNGMRFDLQHPNEFIRGNTLRFVTKLTDAELIEPLLAPLRQCLEHRHAYVRKTAVYAVASVFKTHPELFPDAPETLAKFITDENDGTARRNAFVALASISHDTALAYLSSIFDGIQNADELLQLAYLEFIQKDALQSSERKARYLRLIFDLLEANTSTVAYAAATTLISLTSNPIAIKAASGKLIELAIKEPDNNVKLIVLQKVEQIRRKNEGTLDDQVLEVLRVLSSNDLAVRSKALEIALAMLTTRHVEETVLLLQRELRKTVDDTSQDKTQEWRSLLISTIHQIAIRFQEVAGAVVQSLMDFISEINSSSAAEVVGLVKEVVEKSPKLRPTIVERLTAILGEVRAGKVYRGSLWIVGEYLSSEKEIQSCWKRIRASLGEIPILASEQRALEEMANGEEPETKQNGHAQGPKVVTKTKVLADGTYATESALTSEATEKAKIEAVRAASKPPLRQLILDGDWFLACVLCSTLTKLVMRHSELSKDHARTNALKAEAMLICTSIIRVGSSDFCKSRIDEDSTDRIMSCLRSLSEFSVNKKLEESFLEDTRKAFRSMVAVEDKKREAKASAEAAKTAIQIDDVVSIRQLAKRNATDGLEDAGMDLEKATGGDAATEDLTSKLSRVVQLTGFSDSVYAEAYVKVQQFDILLDILLVNQTADTLQNLTVELATLGDLKVVEKPITQNVGPQDFLNVSATIKVSSTDTGVIFGNIVYDGSSSTENNVVILNDVHVDIMDYIQPASCTEQQFRTMWTEFEWENKVNINSKTRTLREFLAQLMKATNMACLTPEASMDGECQFLSANLYARSVFGEDALANLSIEKEGESGPITGFVRIRSRSQGLALSLGSLKGLKATAS